MTPQDIITDARFVLKDTVSTRYRNTDAELLGWVNDALGAAVQARPDLFNALSTHTCTAGSEQSVSFSRCVQVQEVTRIVGGNAVLQTDRNALDAFRPGWYLDSEAAAVNWMDHPESPVKFYLYPPAPAGQQVQVRFVQAPSSLSLTDTVPISDNYQTALVNFVVGMAESKDDEFINSNRAAQAKADFYAQIKGA